MSNAAPHTLLGEDDLRELIAFRHRLHQHPELSGEEFETARRVRDMLAATSPDEVIPGLGGHGLAAVYDSGKAGRTVMFRAELDALPIQELGEAPHRSLVAGKAHLCGHDGHATILLGLARVLARSRPARGRVILLFQPAEEDGSGAAAVIADPRYGDLRPDYAFALHNLPGHELGAAYIGAGPANCASRGICIRLEGSTAHASQPETGRSPMQAVARIMPALEASGTGGPLNAAFAMVTVTHARMGVPVYGVTPGEAEIRATLRTVSDDRMDALCGKVEALVEQVARAHQLECAFSYDDIFLASTNDAEAAAFLQTGAQRAGLACTPMVYPLRASEDFGRFGTDACSAMLFLGAGKDLPQLHTPCYDFPDQLIAAGTGLFHETLCACMEAADAG